MSNTKTRQTLVKLHATFNFKVLLFFHVIVNSEKRATQTDSPYNSF